MNQAEEKDSVTFPEKGNMIDSILETIEHYDERIQNPHAEQNQTANPFFISNGYQAVNVIISREWDDLNGTGNENMYYSVDFFLQQQETQKESFCGACIVRTEDDIRSEVNIAKLNDLYELATSTYEAMTKGSEKKRYGST